MESSGDALFADDIDDCTPAAVHVSIAGCSNYLMQFEPQLLFLHTLTIVGFANGHQLLATRTRTLESLYHALGTNRIVTCQNRLSVLETSHDRLHDPASKSECFKEYLFSKRE